MRADARRARRLQEGVAAVEFAIVAALLFSVLIGIMEFARVLFYWNTAAEATRLGARLAVVCDKDDPHIRQRMTEMLTILPAAKINIDYEPAGCTIDSCRTVTVSISEGVPVTTVIPFVPVMLTLPGFSTSLPKESMSSASGTNPVCT